MKHIIKQLLYSVLLLVIPAYSDNKVDVVIFSYDRPLQLELLLTSMERFVVGTGEISVVYRASAPAYKKAYKQLQKAYPSIHFVVQGTQPKQDFKPLTEQCAFTTPSEYIVFAVDDNVVKEPVDVSACIDLLEKYHAYGFYLRMGAHLTDCYTMSCKQPLPPLQECEAGVYSWCFIQGFADWGYPNNVDMTLYRKRDIKQVIMDLTYSNPNTLELQWARNPASRTKLGLCFARTKMVNLPLNKVQDSWNNRNENLLQPEEQLAKFNKGLAIAIEPLCGIINKSAHMAYVPTFVKRKR
ncbi:MAG: hypothetical protein ACHQVS_04545 [Candidatus Babeliales bacterium]